MVEKVESVENNVISVRYTIHSVEKKWKEWMKLGRKPDSKCNNNIEK